VESCIFCRIVRGEAPASVVYEDPDVMALLDINPVQRGHTLVIPKSHFVDIWDISPEVLSKVVSVTKLVAHRLQEVLDAEGINTFSASGKPAGQDVYHFHMHVIPLGRSERTKFAEWWLSAMGKTERSELNELAAKLRFS
jgi:histidine triad (HIT) family protein